MINRVAAGTSDFQPANVAIPRHTGGLQDKPMITIDNWPQSPKYGRLYATWVENSGQSQNVVISDCDTRPGGVPDAARCDTPANWTPGASLPGITDASGVYTYPSVAAAPNGDVYVAWWNAGRPPNGNEIEIDSCPAAADCRDPRSWGADTTVDDLEQKGKNGIPFFCPIRPAPGGRVGPQPYVDVGPDGTVFVAYSDLRHNGKRLCTATKRDRTFDSFIAAGPAPGAYPAANTGVRLTDDGPLDRNQHFFPTLAVDPTTGEVQSSFYSTKQDPSQKTTLQYYVGSTDLAATFSPMLAFSTATSNFSGARSDGFDYGDYEGADAAQGVFLPAWTDNRKQPKSSTARRRRRASREPCEPDQQECEGGAGARPSHRTTSRRSGAPTSSRSRLPRHPQQQRHERRRERDLTEGHRRAEVRRLRAAPRCRSRSRTRRRGRAAHATCSPFFCRTAGGGSNVPESARRLRPIGSPAASRASS